MIGPVFFTLIQTSIERGYKSGFTMAIGIAMGDTLYIFICYFGISQLLNSETFKIGLGVVGGIIMLAFGLINLLKPVKLAQQKSLNSNTSSWFKELLKGFMVNGINPFVLIFWIGVVSMATVDYGYNKEEAILFFGTIVVTIFITDNMKAYLAHRLSDVITPKVIKIINMVAGIALIGFAMRLFYYAYSN